ncbi:MULTISPECIES: sulfurtransferase complex subunit TusB [unclassified Colwellia]|jgi:sulfur relay protein TusB/DsrH|uniref:sulfurtransferase complex subunit TusB n=1 Tax=unclassified Colwellia TaxID=196834 RepID=UPI0015F50F39|nr:MULTISPECIES: sulfurtransferase complex subunit TusB [unclassified Colwellia]MBA6362615.1 sulfurtransferase complex subunit TusB [Colwellia sp. BRX8-8]MBA6251701.1 sulfurtransferase complex subunit TusB [Colwellia sp. MB3u-55]MBA6338318.1 sulfurtransferase complex subunit TusB [Colwellia sp. BRX8-7]MBA6346669.1 sulfurtransferase complex subunit TusB [Colwellia sp. BRX8-9]MBA6353486.1 sulfurtransferase complex subunit TusB [Colwellia sp. BRX9-1]
MSMLHLVRTSAFQTSDFEQCLDVIQANDTIVLLDDGCYNLSHDLWQQALSKIALPALYIVEAHAQARAITIDKEKINTLSLDALMTLICATEKSVTWQ